MLKLELMNKLWELHVRSIVPDLLSCAVFFYFLQKIPPRPLFHIHAVSKETHNAAEGMNILNVFASQKNFRTVGTKVRAKLGIEVATANKPKSYHKAA